MCLPGAYFDPVAVSAWKERKAEVEKEEALYEAQVKKMNEEIADRELLMKKRQEEAEQAKKDRVLAKEREA